METYLDGTGYNTYGTGITSIQKLDTGLSGGILNFESCMVSQLDTEKKYKFQTLYIIYIASFHIKKGVRNYVYMII
jgi:hypothetical protein